MFREFLRRRTGVGNLLYLKLRSGRGSGFGSSIISHWIVNDYWFHGNAEINHLLQLFLVPIIIFPFGSPS